MPGAFAEMSRAELFARLAEGRAAAVAVVTPNRRLARVLGSEFASFQAGRGLSAWEDADILPLDAFVVRCYEDALYSQDGGDLPVLLSAVQARALWEEAIRGSRWSGALLDVPATAAAAQESWRLAQAWRIAGALETAPGGEDTQAFADWAKAYARRLKKGGFCDATLLAGLSLAPRKPELLVAYGFDVLAPQARDVLARFECVPCAPERKTPAPRKMSFASPREELEAAARWARARLEQGKGRIGVVVPELKRRRCEAARVFGRVLGSPRCFELSIGEPLAEYPLVAFALGMLEFSLGEKPYEEVSRMLRSPFLGGAPEEFAARARLDASLRRAADAEISLPKLIGMLGADSSLRTILESVFRKSKEAARNSRSPHEWARHFSALLAVAGFPGERALDSAEFQVRAKFDGLLGELARLALVQPGVSGRDALHRLRRLCEETLFQPEAAGGAGAPVQVLELLESAGIGFDTLWVSGLTDVAWPQRTHPDPFLPVMLQRNAGIPEASAEASLALDRRRTAGWLGAADEIVFSWARREDDRELAPSPLIAQVPDGIVELPSFDSYREMIFKKGGTETFTDDKAPALEVRTARGGTRVLADQAACPFRAFAHHRLGAEALDAPEPGLDAMARGQLLHKLMARIWLELKCSSALSGELEATIEKSATDAVTELGLEGRFGELEKQRLIRLAREWLELERARPPFEVVQVEQKRNIAIGGLEFSGRIDRMDRLLEGEMRGSHAIIDYKTGGRAAPIDWMGERPEEPQLPLYAVSASEEVSAVAFAKLKVGEMKFAGFSLRESGIAGVKPAKSWPGLLQYWTTGLERLARGFAQGDARVDPKKGLATCRNCDLQPLCRVHERLSALADGEEERE